MNDKNQQMKDVVEAYESLFDKMKSNHNIKHLQIKNAIKNNTEEAVMNHQNVMTMKEAET